MCAMYNYYRAHSHITRGVLDDFEVAANLSLSGPASTRLGVDP